MSTYSTSGFMVLDSAARRNLELTQSMSAETRGASLLSIIDKTRTAMGGRLLRKWLDQPLLDVERITRRLDSVEEFTSDALMRGEVRDVLGNMQDLERLMGRIVAESANARDLVGLAQSLKKLPELAITLQQVAIRPAQDAAAGDRVHGPAGRTDRTGHRPRSADDASRRRDHRRGLQRRTGRTQKRFA